MAPPRKPAPKITEERKGTVGTGQKPGPLFKPPPAAPAAPARGSRPAPSTGGMFGGGGKAGKAAPSGGGQSFGGIAIPPAPVSGGKTRPGGGDGRPLSLWEFQQQLWNDPRWMNTNKAQNEVTGVADAVMQMFGLRG